MLAPAGSQSGRCRSCSGQRYTLVRMHRMYEAVRQAGSARRPVIYPQGAEDSSGPLPERRWPRIGVRNANPLVRGRELTAV
jgi:hypothetical protein